MIILNKVFSDLKGVTHLPCRSVTGTAQCKNTNVYSIEQDVYVLAGIHEAELEIAYTSQDMFKMVIPIKGMSEVRFEHMPVTRKPGELILINYADGDEIVTPHIESESICVVGSVDWFKHYIGHIETVNVSDLSPIKPMLQHFYQSVFPHYCNDALLLKKLFYDMMFDLRLALKADEKDDMIFNAVDSMLQSNEYRYVYQITEALDISVGKLNSLYEARHGVGIKRYCEIYRMELARKYLSNRSMKIAEVADLLGFSSREGLSKAFKKYFGTTIKEYVSQTEQ